MATKVIFPVDLIEKGISSTNYAMLGLGDIVIPGIMYNACNLNCYFNKYISSTRIVKVYSIQ